MKKLFLFVLLAITTTVALAQVNPQPGYIITNNGDTVRGNIDFRTNEVMAKQCMFRAEGASESKTYKPGEIECFKFDNGKYFISRRLNITGNPQLYFAEFIVQGKMNLYCVEINSDEYYFFEREDGEMAELTNRSIHNMSAEDILQEKREQYGKVKTLLKASNKAAQEVNDEEMTKSKLVNIVRDYHNDVCTDGSNCMVYEYKSAADKVKFHFKVFGSFVYYSQEMTDQQHYAGENYPGSSYEIGLGLELELERVMKGFSAEIGVAFTPQYKSEHDVMSDVSLNQPAHSTYKQSVITMSLGAVKRFGQGKVQPLVRLGGFGAVNMNPKEQRYTPYNHNESEIAWNTTGHFGVYLGAGVQVGIGKHYARIHGDWYKSLSSGDKCKMMKWAATVEFGI